MNPINTDRKLRERKFSRMIKGVIAVKELSGPEYSSTVLNKIMQTASLMIPSPNSKLNNLGYCSYLTIDTAATRSVLEMSEDISRISIISNSSGSASL